MRTKDIWTVAAAVPLMALVLAAEAEVRERPYDFRARLAEVHKPNRRDWTQTGGPKEFGFANGMRVRIGPQADALVARTAEDFCDYLAVSMGLTVSVDRTAGTNAVAVTVRLDPALAARSSRIEVGPRGVAVAASDARAAQQALFHLEDVMNLRRAPFLPFGVENRQARFSPRMTHSGWGCDQFPDAHLDQMAHYGLDAILVYIRDVDVTSGMPKADVADLIRRAKLRGLDTYLYSYVVAFAHPADPGADALFERTYGRIAAAYPDAKGIVFVGESCQFPSRDERALPLHTQQREEVAACRAKSDFRPLAGWFPCRDYADWVKAVKAAVHRHAPEMEIVFWTYNWGYHPAEQRIALLETLPKDIALEVTFEMFESLEKRNGLKSRVADYSMVFPGPGKYFASEAVAAKRLGLRTYAMANSAGLTWDFSTIPYNPFPQQWKKRFDAVVKAQDDWGLAGLMESHHYGWYPNFVAELAKEAYVRGGLPFDRHLRAIAARDFGEANADRAVGIWRDWSDRIVDMDSTGENQYGPFRYGPAYPFNAMEPDLKDGEFPLPPYHLIANYRKLAHKDDELKLQVELFEPMARSFLEGGAAFLSMAEATEDPAVADNARRIGWLGEYMGRCCLTAVNVKRAMMAERAGDRRLVEELARAEYGNVQAALKLVRADSRLGWEPTMHYGPGEKMMEWKLKYLERHYGAGRSAAFTMRFDDNQATSTWHEVAASFERHGLPVSLSIVSSRLSDDQAACLRDLARRGHELMDHTPQHAVYRLCYPAGMEAEFERMAAAPFAHDSDRGARTVFCTAEMDFAHAGNRRLRGSVKGGRFLPDGPDKRIFRGSVIRFGAGPETYAVRPLPEGGGELVDFWGRPLAKKPADADGVDALVLCMAAVQPCDDLLRAQARLARDNFRRLGLPPPRFWIQPGGWEMSVSWERLARIYGGEFGYVGADARVNADRSVVCSATAPDPKNAGPWTMANGEGFFDEGPQVTVEKALAPVRRSLDRNRSYIHLSHLWHTKLPGGQQEMLTRVREFADALSAQGIETVTHTELARRTFGAGRTP